MRKLVIKEDSKFRFQIKEKKDQQTSKKSQKINIKKELIIIYNLKKCNQSNQKN